MKNFILLFSIVTLILSSFFPENNKNLIPLDTEEDYKKQWQQVDSLLGIGLPKSALEVVEVIYKDAKADENHDQILKSYVYRLRIRNSFEEYAFEDLIYEMEADVKTAKFPNNAIMHSMLAEMYWMYYQSNRWQIQGRTNILDFVPDDVQTWTLDNMVDFSIKHYTLSLQNADSLQNTSMKVYNEIINWGTKSEILRPTLYDFLAHRAIDFYSNPEITLTRPADYFQLKEDYYFKESNFFATHNVKSNDTLSLHYNGIKILQDLIYFRYENKNETAALIDADLKRLNYIYRFSVNDNKDELYFSALKKMKEKYAGKENYGEILYSLAVFYNAQASKYNPENEGTHKYKLYKTEAKKLCDNIIKKYAKTEVADKALTLKYQIETHSISSSVEKTIIPNKTFACRIDYKNMDKVYLKVVSIDRKKYNSWAQTLYGYDFYNKLLKNSKEIYTIEKDLPKDNDFNSHSTEILMQGIDISPFGGKGAVLYVVIAANNKDFSYEENMTSYQAVQVSNISYVNQEQSDGTQKVFVLNRETGEPLVGVSVQAYYEKYSYTLRKYVKKLYGSYTSDKNGSFKIKTKHDTYWLSLVLEMTYKNDFYISENGIYMSDYDYEYAEEPYINFFTDRAIYRPGQTVHFKGIVLQKEGIGTKIIPKHKNEVIFYDVNWQIISTQTVESNEFGTFSGSFEIPTGLLNGNMQIYTEIGSKYIKVEEYKRPTFEVKMLPFDGDYILNDSVTVKGTALNYSGAKLTDAQVKFRIQRLPMWFGWRYYNMNFTTVEIGNGTVTTNDDGEFEIKFKAIPDLSIKKSEFTAFNYTISADITDINGETQSTSKSITVGYTGLKVDINFPSQMSKQQDYHDGWKIPISTLNLNNLPIEAKGEIEIFKLKDNDKPLRNRFWAKPEHYLYTEAEWKSQFAGNVYKDENKFENYEIEKSVYKTDFNTEKEKFLKAKFIKKWDSGIYVVKISSQDKFGNKVSYKRFFTLFSEKENNLAYNTTDFFAAINTLCEPGETAKFTIGSGLENTKILYQISQGDKLLKEEWLEVSNAQELIEIPITEEHRGNIAVNFLFVKNNRMYSHSATVVVPHSDKDLDIEFSTFRDKLYPGQKEEWQIKIKGAKGDKVLAEMVATLYDASLDQFAANSWYQSFYSSFYNDLYWASSTFGLNNSTMLSENYNLYHYYTPLYYNSLNWYGFSYYSYGGYYGGDYYWAEGETMNVATGIRTKNGNARMNKNKEKSDHFAYRDEAMEESFDDEILDGVVATNVSLDQPKAPLSQTIATGENMPGKDLNFDNVQIRENFNETAFFYPHLKTDENGDVIISFTIPESLTKWKFMGFAHTKEMDFGYINEEVVTQKDLMLMPNAPRFFREGDKMTFPVKINNISKTDFEGEIKLEFIDAITMKPVDNIIVKSEEAQKKFSVKADKNTLVEWQIEIPHGIGLVSYKVVATTGKFSDGEQKAIPVMSNRMLVTESMPLPIRGAGTKEFKFKKLINSSKSKTIKHHRYTLEFTSNPAWYAVQALPYLIEYPYECSEQTFSRYYANTLASHIANSSPKIKAVFDAWKNTPKSEALLSNLEKNQELKAVLLQETPWVLNSQDETERKRRIGLLFDLNTMAREQKRALKKLQREQTINGGWAWFKGMPESRYITQYIVTGIGHLINLNVIDLKDDYDVSQMVTKAIGYLDRQIVRDYKWLKKNYTEKELEKNHLSQIAIHYCYGRSYFTDNQMNKRTQEAFDYYKSQMQKYWLTRSKYEQGMISLALHRFKDEKIPKMIINSLREHSIEDEELGMYWKDNVAGYYWYQAPIETQAILIEAFDEVADDQKSVESMKVWLLKNKQTSDWKTTKATVEAVYALLLRGMEMLADDELCEVTIGGTKIDPKTMDEVQVEAGTGYYKVAWTGNEVKPNMGNVTVTKKTAGVAWGAVYWQYFEDLDKITTHETPLKLKKELFKEVITDKGEVIVPIKNEDLKVGDKVIVRIELRVDRAMDYVHMKDMRASGFEPINVISRYKWQDGLGYYESTKDASTNFFISHLPKGTFVFEYPLRVTHTGDFSNGITTIQCMYAPEFTSHSEGIRVKVKK